MKRILLTVLLALFVVATKATNELPVPAVSMEQIARLWKGEDPEVVLKGLNLKKFLYNYEEGTLCSCSFGYHVEMKDMCNFVHPLANDAYGITYCDAGEGGWEIEFKNEAIAEAYREDFKKNGYHPVYEQWQESVAEDGRRCKYLEYIDSFDGECVRMYFNGETYYVRIAVEPYEELSVFWLHKLAELEDTPLAPAYLDYYHLKDLSYKHSDKTYHLYGRNSEYNPETMEEKLTGPDALQFSDSHICFSNKELMPLYISEALKSGYQPLDSLGWKDVESDGKFSHKELEMYINRGGIWGGAYGENIIFLDYDDYGCVMLQNRGEFYISEEPWETREPAVTIKDLEKLLSKQATLEELRQKITDAGQENELKIDDHRISFKDKNYLHTYEIEAYKSGYHVDRKEGEDGWRMVVAKGGIVPAYSLTLHKDGKTLDFDEDNLSEPDEFRFSICLY